jgi:3,4-dihydroxy 2-butanone 4-phosphate synthase/GTP cyclohydrolase II
MHLIDSEKTGIIIYLRQEGRGIGLGNKIKAYNLQEEKGLDTIEANKILGFHPDMREYSIAAEILKLLNVNSVRLITNNPQKILGLEKSGIKVVNNINQLSQINSFNKAYLQTKRDKFGHKIIV